MIETVCKQNKLWQDRGLSMLRIAINISALQFQDKKFIGMVEHLLNKYQLAPELLEFEITESVMQNVKESSTILRQLREFGVKICIDDFGTGYSSLSVLNRLSIDFVKIDKSFVKEITKNSNTASLVKTMIEMGKNLEFDLIAEGIEDEQQHEFLIENGCRFGQGYLYSKPLLAKEVEVLIKKQLVKHKPTN